MPTQDLAKLHPVFLSSALRLLARIDELGLPLRVWETYRTVERQEQLYLDGKSKIRRKGSHTVGCAFDLVLREHPVNLWTNGVDESRTTVDEPATYEVWRRLGQLIHDEFPELEWGGDWRETGQLLGWDPYHVQLAAWEQYDPDEYDPDEFAELNTSLIVEVNNEGLAHGAGGGGGALLLLLWLAGGG